jgi:WD40 repeat protein
LRAISHSDGKSDRADAEKLARFARLDPKILRPIAHRHQVVTLPGSHGIFSPRWSPNGRYIVGLTSDQAKVVLFDFQTQKWSELAKGGVGWPSWSKDGESVYLLATGDRAVLKIRASTGQVERVADLKSFRPTEEWGWLLALAPDDSLFAASRRRDPGRIRPRLGKTVTQAC